MKMEVMKKQSAVEMAICWIDPNKGIISFHFVEGFKQKAFSSRREMILFCCHAINGGYKIQ